MELCELVGPLLTWVQALEPGRVLAALALVEGGVLIGFALRAVLSPRLNRVLELTRTRERDEVALASPCL